MNEQTPLIPKQRKDLLFNTCLSRRYHRSRAEFFENIENVSTISNLLIGSAAIFTLLQKMPTAALAFVSAITVLAAFGVVIGFTRKARVHGKLAYAFEQLESDIITTPEPTVENLQEWMARRIEIEHDEPPTKLVLSLKMYNRQCLATGQDDGMYHIPWWKGMTAQYVDLWPDRIRRKPPKLLESPSANPMAAESAG